ncbi:MAG: hypothetical protein KDD13_11980, partial [Mangrovimonas sp.]|nr:hypothetical protein [Mangrovimonas sp.]
MPKLFKLSFLLLLVGQPLLAQDAKPDAYQDSLQNVIATSASGETKKEALFLLGEHLVQRDPDLAEKIAEDLKRSYLKGSDSSNILRINYI